VASLISSSYEFSTILFSRESNSSRLQLTHGLEIIPDTDISGERKLLKVKVVQLNVVVSRLHKVRKIVCHRGDETLCVLLQAHRGILSTTKRKWTEFSSWGDMCCVAR